MSKLAKFLMLTACLTLIISSLTTAKSRIDIESDTYVVSKDSEVLPYQVSTYLQKQNKETVKVWVFYTDKGFTGKTKFAQAAASVQYSEKVLKRRKKANIDKILFIDIPVHADYVSQIEALGFTLRRNSKWLNASSFEVSIENLDKVRDLGFVKSIKPMVSFKRDYSDIAVVDDVPFDKNQQPQFSSAILNYGSSFTQLNQINVPAVHLKGYSGAGVTLCLTDTGYRKSHAAFAAAYADGRVISEYDFINNDANTANEAGDVSDQWSHGTLIWSVSAGKLDGTIYGPAYNANILLAKTEDVPTETPVEEDNWVAALEWADSLGADVISTSLGYSDWYTTADYDGNTAVITLAANTCASLGIVLCNSMGNSGPGGTTLSAPADAFDILAVGAVNFEGDIASFSSRGPTSDGRLKPEICAMGVSTYSASSSGDNNYTTASGTSLSTPIVAGAVCLLIEARPGFSPLHVRQAIIETADRADTPDNNYGYGIMDINAALGWGANIAVDVQTGDAPITVNFNGSSPLTVTSWLWDFGDGATSTDQNPSHTYTTTGLFDVSLTVDTDVGIITNHQTSFIAALGDTLTFVEDSAFAGNSVVFSVSLTNTQSLSEIHVPFRYFDHPKIVFDSVTLGTRTSYFDGLTAIAIDAWNKKYTYKLTGSPDLPAGSGEIMQIHFTIDEWELGGQSFLIDTSVTPFAIELTSPSLVYAPKFQSGVIKTKAVLRGDMTQDFQVDISDIVFLVDFIFTGGVAPLAGQMGDVNDDEAIDISDVVYIVDFIFTGGPPPVNP